MVLSKIKSNNETLKMIQIITLHSNSNLLTDVQQDDNFLKLNQSSYINTSTSNHHSL